MPIHNNVGIASYRRTMTRGQPGAPAMAKMPEARPYMNPLAKQVSEFTVGGTAAAGDYSITFKRPGADDITVTFTRVAETNDGISDGLLAAIQAETELEGIVESSVDSDTNDLQVTFEHEGVEYEFETSAPSGAQIDHTLITDPAGSEVPIGRFVVNGGQTADGQRSIALPDGSAETDIVGILMRPLGTFANGESPLQSAVDAVPAGAMCDVAFEGAVLMRNVGSTDAAVGGSVFVVVATTGGDELGEAAAEDDGANRVELPARNAYWAEETAAGEVGPVYLRL